MDKLSALRERASPCRLCPRACGARRAEGELGFCGVGIAPLAAHAGPHFGEESELVGRGGSGTIFFGGCNLACIFCQNGDLSFGREGRETTVEDLAAVMLRLQQRGCENINLVTPTHVAHAAAAAVARAREGGLVLPIVYNCGGYEDVDTLRLLDGYVDIYMPDAKYGPAAPAERLSGVADYFPRMAAALQEMHRQVGDLTTDGRGVARRGLLVRHLVLPNNLADSAGVFRFLAQGISAHTYVNIMGQYRPAHRADEVTELTRPPTAAEMATSFAAAKAAGLPCDYW